MNWTALLSVVVGVLMVFMALSLIRRAPDLFSKDNLSKSIFTFGILTLMLIFIIAICVWFLR